MTREEKIAEARQAYLWTYLGRGFDGDYKRLVIAARVALYDAIATAVYDD